MPRPDPPPTLRLVGLFLQRLWQRMAQIRMGQAAASLSFAWLLAMVPLLTVALAVSTSFSDFESIRKNLQALIVAHFLPDGVGSQLSRYLDQFVRKAAGLSLVGLVFLGITATVMMFTLDKTLNLIWRPDRSRSFYQRLLIYWVALLLGPLAVGAGAMGLSWLVGSPKSFGTLLGLAWWDWMNLLLTWLAYTLCYTILPMVYVDRRAALIGAGVAALLTELAAQFFGGVLVSVPTYRQIYGTLAAFPLLLIWTYLTWWLFLFGAVLAAEIPLQARGASMQARENLDRPAGEGAP